MPGDALAGVRKLLAALCVGLLSSFVAHSASASDCAGHPDALGTSRTLVVDPREHPRIGTMQYPETLPLRDHEVVLTFDDGPLPRNSDQVLRILASQCVKATFFAIGRMAQAYPEGVRKLVEAGHSVGTHTQNHPLTMNRMPIDAARQEIDEGIASVKSALGDAGTLAPFFRIPGLLRAQDVEDYLELQGIQIWSADFLADDWRHISSSRVFDLAIKRLEERGKGILLLHDIQARTVAALPRILNALKVRGYRIVHVVPATPQTPATPTDPQEWRLYPVSENVAISRWPKIPNFAFRDIGTLPAPATSELDWPQVQVLSLAEEDRGRPLRRGILPARLAWPRALPLEMAQAGAVTTLPVPDQTVFQIQEGFRAATRGLTSPHRAEQTRPADDQTTSRHARNLPRTIGGKSGRTRHANVHQKGQAAPGRRGAIKHLVQVRKRSA
jgi:peptidoglycan/xylan/chitin deacetylase (PgdA/CDA1 family)